MFPVILSQIIFHFFRQFFHGCVRFAMSRKSLTDQNQQGEVLFCIIIAHFKILKDKKLLSWIFFSLNILWEQQQLKIVVTQHLILSREALHKSS